MISGNKTQYLAGTGLLIVFIIDWLSPVNFMFDMLYLCCILMVFKQSIHIIRNFSIAACLLVMLDLFVIAQHQELALSVYLNRGISILAIGVTTYITIRYKKASQEVVKREQAHTQMLQSVLFATSHRIRKPLANILGIVALLKLGLSELSDTELELYIQHLQLSADEADRFIRELNEVLELGGKSV